MFVAERLIADLIKIHIKHSVSTDGENMVFTTSLPVSKIRAPFAFSI
jgi:hypothetical protein